MKTLTRGGSGADDNEGVGTPITLPVTYRPVPYVPEVSIRQAEPDAGLWDESDGSYHSDRPPPFWAFPWPGGQALARFVIDHRDTVVDRRVLDLGAGSGLVALAAAIAGARHVTAVDTDPAAIDAIRHNVGMTAVGDRIDAVRIDLLDLMNRDRAEVRELLDTIDVLLAGDLFYTAPLSNGAMRFLRTAERSGARVLVGDAGRGFLPTRGFRLIAHYDVPTRAAVEDSTHRRASVWELRPSAPRTVRPDGS